MADVVIYTKKGCPYCARAREHYAQRGIAFDDIDIFDHPEAQQNLLELSRGERIVPVVVDNGVVRVGWDGG